MNRGKKKSPGLHAKLMSPERKKKTPMETEAAMRERHERASSARRQLETERAARLRARGETVASASDEAERQKFAKALQLEARHRRAEETREERISAVVRKAGEETRKVEEIAFYNSLDVENKKAALRERLVSAEQRRAAQTEERRRAAEAAESAARAAEERRAMDEERSVQLEEKVREKEARRAKEAAEREALAAEIERSDRERRRTESEVAKENEAKRAAGREETRRGELAAAEDRRREYLTRQGTREHGGSASKSKIQQRWRRRRRRGWWWWWRYPWRRQRRRGRRRWRRRWIGIIGAAFAQQDGRWQRRGGGRRDDVADATWFRGFIVGDGPRVSFARSERPRATRGGGDRAVSRDAQAREEAASKARQRRGTCVVERRECRARNRNRGGEGEGEGLGDDAWPRGRRAATSGARRGGCREETIRFSVIGAARGSPRARRGWRRSRGRRSGRRDRGGRRPAPR